MNIKPKLGMIVIVKDDNQDQVAVIQDIHMNGQRFWVTNQDDQYGSMYEVMIRSNGAWKTKNGRKTVELTIQNEFHSQSLDKRVA